MIDFLLYFQYIVIDGNVLLTASIIKRYLLRNCKGAFLFHLASFSSFLYYGSKFIKFVYYLFCRLNTIARHSIRGNKHMFYARKNAFETDMA